MRILIVESDPKLAKLWAGHLAPMGMEVETAHDQDSAMDLLLNNQYSVIVLNLVLKHGSALAISDYASYRHPNTRVIFVTNSSFFSDGSIFYHSANACAFVPQDTSPDDLAVMVDYYADTHKPHLPE